MPRGIGYPKRLAIVEVSILTVTILGPISPVLDKSHKPPCLRLNWTASRDQSKISTYATAGLTFETTPTEWLLLSFQEEQVERSIPRSASCVRARSYVYRGATWTVIVSNCTLFSQIDRHRSIRLSSGKGGRP